MMRPLLPLHFVSSHSAGRHSKLLPQMHSVCAFRPCCRLSRGPSANVAAGTTPQWICFLLFSSKPRSRKCMDARP